MENDSYIETCAICFLSIERAKKLVPPEFIEGWNWFQQRAGTTMRVLPHRDPTLNDASISLTRDAGIHSPDYKKLRSRGADKNKYVLSIHAGGSRYNDKDLIYLEDGTWILDYCSQKPERGRKATTDFNSVMMNNLRDGIPIAVMIKQSSGGYMVCGLGFIEEYNAATESFIIHGPVNPSTEAAGFFSIVEAEHLSDSEIQILKEWDAEDERVQVKVNQIRRQGQERFRKALRDAYEDTCVISSVAIPEVLQAAHIYSYRGPKTQIVNNGLLLRSDLHLLFDAHLFTIHPENHKVVLSDQLKASDYKIYNGIQIADPCDRRLSPSDELLNIHYQQFLVESR